MEISFSKDTIFEDSEFWASNNRLKFPCSNQNIYKLRIEPENKLSKWKLIKERISQPISNFSQLSEVIMSYSPSFVNEWNFDSLNEFCNQIYEPEKFWNVTLPFISKMACKLDSLFKEPAPLLSRQVSSEIWFTQEQCASLIANMFFCTFPQRSYEHIQNESESTIPYFNFPNVNFNTLFSKNYNLSRPNKRVQKLSCIIHYFNILATKGLPSGKVSFRRQILYEQFVPVWEESQIALGTIKLDTSGFIEDQTNCSQVDFANKFIGGGVLSSGCVQEEIRFVTNPELLVARLITEKLDSNEALIINGTQKFCKYSGYAATFEFDGDYIDNTPKDQKNRIDTTIIAIDAIHFSKQESKTQNSLPNLYRELNKAYVGFLLSEGDPNKPIATGHWGCGAFFGEKQLKALIQWMAASQANRNLVYFSFKDFDFHIKFSKLISAIHKTNLKIGNLFKIIRNWNVENMSLFDHVDLEIQKM